MNGNYFRKENLKLTLLPGQSWTICIKIIFQYLPENIPTSKKLSVPFQQTITISIIICHTCELLDVSFVRCFDHFEYAKIKVLIKIKVANSKISPFLFK
ncbi:unnamed protein product [Acanthoscelides obtectus]|uniref:Uncharacterized protein n=1 Tax=Acanthoscelides obtectus TaxID=200917 RepID=A0A9P0KSF6_ACAOB|nr:unnamed protein product [Acanthoscelides obtectus]CAH1980783.1 unnamed protein product [Acanthoscelides obtectus]CAH1990882.1 unnamed protein product [Acanthoscelides obtectus]CAK1635952.1 hypothetical protein AOBTE_LOCUS9650 [Acanthoscelides obtectus]CAK1652695.1 hypothetical protein AOBTE_LOCUS17894 [Acanthoscelides obtectus]